MTVDTTTTRLTRADWLRQALAVLAEEGEAELRIDHLAARLGVTKGSFYWHFEGQRDFLRQVARYWFAEYTESAAQRIRELDGSASEKLLELMKMILERQLTKYDLVVRSWATHDDSVAAIIRESDKARLATVRGLFAETGFEGEELEVRTRLFVTFMSFDGSLAVTVPLAERLARLPRLHQLLTRP